MTDETIRSHTEAILNQVGERKAECYGDYICGNGLGATCDCIIRVRAKAIIRILDNRPQIRDDDYEWADTDRLVPDPAPSESLPTRGE